MRYGVVAITLGYVVSAVLLASCSDSSSGKQEGVFAYWDNNEEEDALLPDGELKQLVPPWDPNGQMCIFRDGSGRFATPYDPTLPSQHNPGGLKPYHDPPIGLDVWDQHGNFTGQTIFVPGPYALPGSTIGGDIPPDATGNFNNDGTYTGCAFDSAGRLFAADLGSAQGSSASPDQGRIVEWFPPDYQSYCIIDGPTEGGVGPHHVDGTGGLRNPGIFATDESDNLYVPESGNGRVLRYAATALPRSVADCGPDGLLSPPAARVPFITGTGGVPGGIARDPTCDCWAVSNILGSPAVGFFDNDGQPTAVKGSIPAGPYNPFGVAVTPGGDLFFVDISLSCDANGCNTVDYGGGVFRVTFQGGVPSAPERIIGGLDFPTSVTVCDSSQQLCPEPPAGAAPPDTGPAPGGGGSQG